MKEPIEKILAGGDLRSIGRSNFLISRVKDQQDFDQVFKCLYHSDRLVVMRAADAIEKITINHSNYLAAHKKEIFKLCKQATDKELKWHLALLIPRLPLTKAELKKAWALLAMWAKDKANSRIVRVNSLQGLYELLPLQIGLHNDLMRLLSMLEKEDIPSFNARIRALRKKLPDQRHQ